MENYILYYYKLNITNYIKQSNYYYININEDIYYFCKTNKQEQELNEYNNLLSYKYHKLIRNKDNKIITIYNNEPYCLLKINTLLNDIINIDEILKEKKIYVKDKSIEWNNIWIEKVEYISNQINKLDNKNLLIKNSFTYFSGLAENAISYYNNNKVSGTICLCHHRIYYPNIPINYYNTLNIIKDYEARDYAEYIKSKFYSNEDVSKDIKIILNNNLSNNDIKLFYNRLLFPSNYFDILEDLIINPTKELEKKLYNIINLTDKYEIFLKDTYYEINNKYDIEPIDWIIKKSNKL